LAGAASAGGSHGLQHGPQAHGALRRVCPPGASGRRYSPVSATWREIGMMHRLPFMRSMRPFTPAPSLHDVGPQGPYAAAQAVVLPDTEALLAMKPGLRRSLSARFGVQGLAARLCPVELEDGSVAIFALAEHVASDQADELARRIALAGLRAADPPRYILHASLLLAVARDAFGRQGGAADNPIARGALAEAFHELV